MKNKILDDIQSTAQASMLNANCLPFGAYHDPLVFDRELQEIFHNDWIFVCAEQQVSSIGQYFALDIAGEAVVVLRGKDNELRALSNICRHRGTPLLDTGLGSINNNIVCPYHAWTFDDTGTFKGAPFSNDTEIEPTKHCLPTFNIALWHSLVFINLCATAPPLAEKVAGIDQFLAHYDLNQFKQHYCLPTQHWHTNWKLAVENGIESYHLFRVHQQTLEKTTPTNQAFYVAGNANWALTAGLINNPSSKILKWFAGTYPHAHDHYLLVFLPPSFIAVVTYDGLHWIQVLPIDATHCEINTAGFYAHKSGQLSAADTQFTHAFLKEDQDICERVQQGMYSVKSKGGKLVNLEQILVDFHQYLAKKLFNTAPDSFIENPKANIFKQH